ncbi:putative lipase atg15, partial [Mortierella claussenii]
MLLTSPVQQDHDFKYDQALPLLQDRLQAPLNPIGSVHSRPESDAQQLLFAGQEMPSVALSLRHVLHHGGPQFPGLFKRLDIASEDMTRSGRLKEVSPTHRIKVKTTSTLKSSDKSYRNLGLRSLGRSLGPRSWAKELIAGPDITDKETVLQFAKMNYNSYTEVANPGWYDLEGHWNVNSTFGWEEDGVRGHIFASADNSTLIIAIKGTSLLGGGSTSTRDKIN